MMICDQIDACGQLMPNQAMAEQITDSIYDDVCRMYPDVAEYARKSEESMNEAEPTVTPFDFGDRRDGRRDDRRFDRRFRRRGLFRDIIDILLLQELFGRRRRRF
jgi:hypothetical protein